MKKIIIVFMMIFVMFSLAACGEEQSSGETGTEAAVQSGSSKSEEEKESPSSEVQSMEADEPSDNEMDGTDAKALVVYFSATGNTKAVAEMLAELQDADIYEIVPEQPYIDEDLDYNDSSTRATKEQNDPDARPAISGEIENFEQYETVYVGYPIWWGDMPKILYTFFDTYDFKGKTIAPFCTSGGSGLSGTPGTIEKLEEGATVLDGLQISDSSADNSKSEVEEWLADIGQEE